MQELVVLFGGPSSERKVSVASAQNVASVLDQADAWFWAPGGEIHQVERADLIGHARPFEVEFVPRAAPSHASLQDALDDPRARNTTFILALHGGVGENGTVQKMFEERRIAFTGPGSDASAKAFDKEWAKRLASAAGVLIAESVHLPRGDQATVGSALLGFLGRHGRIVAKPVADGSSVGLHHIGSVADAQRAAAAIAASGDEYLAEAFVAGTELTVAVVDEERGARALPASEVRLEAGRAFDYDGKYLGKGTREITPAEVPERVSRAAQRVALDAHKALGCEGYSRTDVICSERGPVFLEINTLPGLTRMSFVPQQLAAEGTSMKSFLEGQIALARRRRNRG
ncbi:MAG TPA: ATP-grasp domain-containing protein [Myxococcales bacterium]|jgi:D-alanine-D-alanine ligase|nr:ATP-grasp domain-containing protein [Myxococcales bacterium]